MLFPRSILLWCLASLASAACQKTCIVPSSNGAASDSPAIAQVLIDCANNSVILFPKGVEYNVWEPLSATKLSNVVISVQGNLNLPQNISYIQAQVTKAADSLTWFKFGGINVQYIGSSDVSLASRVRMD